MNIDWSYLENLKEDFDDEGGSPPSKEVIEKAKDFLERAEQYFLERGRILKAPTVHPFGQSSLNISWRISRYVGFHLDLWDGVNLTSFYGSFEDGGEIKGKVMLDERVFLLIQMFEVFESAPTTSQKEFLCIGGQGCIIRGQ